MSDIVERLHWDCNPMNDFVCTSNDLMFAAAEIKRLRAENATLRQALKNHAEEAAKMVNAEPVLWFDEDTFQISRDKPLRPTYIPLYASPRIPEGWVLVPKLPTEEMMGAFKRGSIGNSIMSVNAYRVMIAAAPKPDGR